MTEDVFEWPPKWQSRILPRRGGTPVARPNPRPALPASALARRGDRIRAALDRPGYEADVASEATKAIPLVQLARGDLPEPGVETPFGVAAAIHAGLLAVPWADRNEIDGVADLVVAERGPVFAARTVAELAGLVVGGSLGKGGHTVVRRWADDDPPPDLPPSWDGYAAHVRRLIGTVHRDAHDDIVAALAPYRDGVLLQRAATSYLVPDRHDWVDADIAAVAGRRTLHGGPTAEAWLLLHAAHTAGQAVELAGDMSPYLVAGQPAVIATVIDGVGPGVAPLLAGWADHGYDTDLRRSLLDTIARLPGDEAYGALLARADDRLARAALLAATRRFPRRALRVLAAAPPGPRADRLLRDLVLTKPDEVEAVLSAGDTGNGDRIAAIRDAAAAVVEAKPEDLPPLLVRPPWTVARKRPRPVVIAGLEAAPERGMAWLDGERERWLAHRDQISQRLEHDSGRQIDWEHAVRLHRQRRLPQRQEEILVAWGPDELVRPLVSGWRASWTPDPDRWLRVAVARFGLDALPYVRRRAEESPAAEGRYLLPYATSDLAVLMAGWLARLKSGRAVAAQWLDRHAALAARTLAPRALGKAGPARREAEEALRTLAGRAHRVTVLEAAAGHGPAAADGIAALLDRDPLDVLPAKPPAPPDWLDARLLPPVQLRSGAGAVPTDGVQHICTMLAMSRPDAPYAGVAIAQEAADLAGLGWALFERWEEAGAPSRDNWVLPALGLTGDDDTVRRLAPLIRAWPGEGGHARAVTGLDVLRAIGTDVALMHLHGISEKVKFKGLRDKAKERVAEIADDLGLTADELADRLVPDFGLDDPTFDFGPRQFTVGFDEQLRPYVVDGSGKRRAALPKPGAADDPELAAAAGKRFAAVKKDVRTAAADQLRRLERAMVAGRRWPAAAFRTHLAGHPLMRHIVRRLVFSVDGGGSFRVAEDGTFADVADDVYVLPDYAVVGVAHPLGLAEGWAGVFADYEILQPFPQLARETFALTADELTATSLSRWTGRTVPTGALLGLERRGWRRAEPQDGGSQPWLERDLPGADRRILMIMIEPGIAIGMPTAVPEQRIQTVQALRPHDYPWHPKDPLAMGALDAVTASELIRDLEGVVQ